MLFRRVNGKGQLISMNTKNSYSVSIIFGVMPLIIGSLIFALWYFIRSDILLAMGSYVIIFGLASVLIAFISLIVYLKRNASAISRGMMFKKSFLLAMIIISNFVAAGFYALAVIYIMTTYYLTIENKSTSAVTNIVVTAPGCTNQIALIEPNGKELLKLSFQGDGTLDLKAKQNQEEQLQW